MPSMIRAFRQDGSVAHLSDDLSKTRIGKTRRINEKYWVAGKVTAGNGERRGAGGILLRHLTLATRGRFCQVKILQHFIVRDVQRDEG